MKPGVEMAGRALVLGLLLLGPLAGCDCRDLVLGPSGGETDVSDRSYTFAGDGLAGLEVALTNGAIVVKGGTGAGWAVRIRRIVHADTREEAEGFARRVRILVEEGPGAVRIQEDYPRPPDHAWVETRCEVECPASVRSTLRVVNGVVRVVGTTGSVRAVAVNGSIDARLDLLGGEGVFNVTNGRVAVAVGIGNHPLAAGSVNGPVSVTLRQSFSGLLDARTVNGSVRCGASLGEVKVHTRTALVARIGLGRDTPVELRAVNGDVTVTVSPD